MKYNLAVTLVGVGGTLITSLFGGWDSAKTTLCIFMLIDFIMGVVVAGVFKKSPKTETGGYSSNTGFKGFCKKIATLLIVAMAYRLDVTLGFDYIQEFICIAFIFNEGVSIIENAGLMGLPIPKILTNALDVLKSKVGEENA